MNKIKVGINGFGRIGRIAARIILARPDLELAAINSRAEASSHAYLLKYDSTYGTLKYDIKTDVENLNIDGRKISVFNKNLPEEIPWENSGADIVIDATGKFRSKEDLSGHLKSGARFVVLSAPAKDDTKTIVMGVNQDKFNPKKDFIVSNSSCTTNCLTTTLKVLNDNFKVIRGFMTTIHAVTDSQNLLDNSHKKEVRLRRSALASIIPAATGSAKDVGKLFPQLFGKIMCQAIRVPLLTVSIINLTVQTSQKTTEDEVNSAFEKASLANLKGILSVAKEELVSRDFVGSPFSSVVDPFLTRVSEENLINVYAWYDNEWGYTERLVDMVSYIGRASKII